MWSRWEGSLSETPVPWLISRCDSGSNQKGGLTGSVTASLTKKAQRWAGVLNILDWLLNTSLEWKDTFLFRNSVYSKLIYLYCFLEALNLVASHKPHVFWHRQLLLHLPSFSLLLFLNYLFHSLFPLQQFGSIRWEEKMVICSNSSMPHLWNGYCWRQWTWMAVDGLSLTHQFSYSAGKGWQQTGMHLRDLRILAWNDFSFVWFIKK